MKVMEAIMTTTMGDTTADKITEAIREAMVATTVIEAIHVVEDMVAAEAAIIKSITIIKVGINCL